MERNVKKIVYEDNGITKVIKGYIIEDTEFLITIETIGNKARISIGKRAIIKMCEVGGPQ